LKAQRYSSYTNGFLIVTLLDLPDMALHVAMGINKSISVLQHYPYQDCAPTPSSGLHPNPAQVDKPSESLFDKARPTSSSSHPTFPSLIKILSSGLAPRALLPVLARLPPQPHPSIQILETPCIKIICIPSPIQPISFYSRRIMMSFVRNIHGLLVAMLSATRHAQITFALYCMVHHSGVVLQCFVTCFLTGSAPALILMFCFWGSFL